MPFKDPEAKRAWNKAWREHGKEHGYNKWLYERRKLRFEDAKEFRKALETICDIGETRDVEVAWAALRASDRRRKKLGPSPRMENGTPTPQKPAAADSLFEAVAKLGLK